MIVGSGYGDGGISSLSGATIILQKNVSAVSGSEPNAVQIFVIKATSNTVNFSTYGCAAIAIEL